MNVNITDVAVLGTSGDGFFFDLGSNNAAISNINIANVAIAGAGGSGIDFDLSRTQFADIQVASSSITTVGGDGIGYTASGDSRSVFTGLGNTITAAGESGIDLDTFGTSEMLLVLTSNEITTNLEAGLDVNASGTNSRISARLQNNNLSTNGTFGFFMRTTNNGTGTDGGLLDVLAVSNSISNNDASGTVGRDMFARNSSLSRICLAMSNNFFVLPASLQNLGAPADYIVELDGATNGIGQPVFVPSAADFDLRTFGTVCEPAIAAQEGVFAGLGF